MAQAAPDSLRTALLEQARLHSPDLAARRAAVRSAAGQVNAATAREAPVLSAEIDEIADGEVWNAGQMQVGVEQEFFTGRRRRAVAGIASVELRRHELSLALAEQALGARIDRELNHWRGQRAIEQRLSLEERLLRDVEEGLAGRFATGQARYVDVLRVRTERLRVQSDRADATNQGSQARLRLLLLVGVDSLLEEPVRQLDDSLPPTLAPDSLFDALEAAGLFSLGEAQAERERQRLLADRAPRFGGGLGVQRFGEPGSFRVGPALRASISLPFAVSGSNRAVRTAADLVIAERSARAAADRATVRSGLRQAAASYTAARNRAQLFDAALLRGSRTEREAALAAYRTGELTLIELLDFERALARAETDQIRAVIEAHAAYADLLELMRGQDD